MNIHNSFVSFVCQPISYRTKSLQKNCERIMMANFSD